MKILEFHIPGVILFELSRYNDERGFFQEIFRSEWLLKYNINKNFVQDNLSISKKNVLRGLHFQVEPYQQGKLISVLSGKILDVLVDIRKKSPHFGKFLMIELDAKSPHLLWIPEGFAHGFLSLEDNSIVFYKCTNYYNKEAERTLLWNDPEIGIPWPISNPIISEKDKKGILLADL